MATFLVAVLTNLASEVVAVQLARILKPTVMRVLKHFHP